MKPQFGVSLMCMNYFKMEYEISILNEKADSYHIDIMDGHFVKNLALSPDFLKSLSGALKKPVDAHLMTTTPTDWLEPLVQAGADTITVHAETINTDAFRVIDQIKSLGCKAGVVINPSTPIEYIKHYLNRIDTLMLMTVDPGFGGQPFVPEVLDKIKEADHLKNEFGYSYNIQVDGNNNVNTYKKLYDAGARMFVLGSTGLFNLDPDVNVAFEKMRKDFCQATGIQL